MTVTEFDKMKAKDRRKTAKKLTQRAAEHEARAEAAMKQVALLTEAYNKHCDRAYCLRRMAYALEQLPEDSPNAARPTDGDDAAR